MNTQQNKGMTDQEIFSDALVSQKFLAEDYNLFAGECSTPAIYNSFMSILAEEHTIQNDVFCEMEKRGWYQTQPADANKVNEIKTKYAGFSFA